MVRNNHDYGKNMISFKSKVTIKILNYYFLNPDAKYYINELANILSLDPKNVYLKLKELEKEGILDSEFRGKERYFSLAKNYPLLDNYRQIFLKTFGLEQKLKHIIDGIQGVEEAYIYGSYASNKMDSSSDIDMLLVGSHSTMELQKIINRLQKETGREFNIINLNKKEFEKMKKDKDQFISNIFKGTIIKLL